MTPVQLRKQIARLNAELEARAPDLAAELRLLKSLLESKEVAGSTKPFEGARSPWDAIELCLNLSGDFKLTQPEMVDAILAGGYIHKKPNAARGIINSSINHHVRSENLIRRGDLIGRPKSKH